MKFTHAEINQARHLMTPGTAEILLDYADSSPTQSTAPTACATSDAQFWAKIQADRRSRGQPALTPSEVTSLFGPHRAPRAPAAPSAPIASTPRQSRPTAEVWGEQIRGVLARTAPTETPPVPTVETAPVSAKANGRRTSDIWNDQLRKVSG